jgi:hypothetical protein
MSQNVSKKRKRAQKATEAVVSDAIPGIQRLSKSQLRLLIQKLSQKHKDIDKTIQEFVKNDRDLNEMKCKNCGEMFNLLDKRKNQECCYHPGKLDEEVEDAWDDWDPDIHGPPIGTRESKKEYPECYLFSCCKQTGDSEGCQKGIHK